MRRPLCDGGYAEACTELAVIHGAKRTPKDLALAKSLLKKACAGGDARACQMQASMPK